MVLQLTASLLLIPSVGDWWSLLAVVVKQASKLLIITLVEEQFIVQDIKLSSLGMMCRTYFKGFAYITLLLMHMKCAHPIFV